MQTKPDQSSQKASTSKAMEATAMLKADHQLISTLFKEYEKAETKAAKKKIVSQICLELSIHAQIEEEIFYPGVKAVLKDKTLIPEAIVEHATLKSLIAQVEGVEPDGEMFDAKIKVLDEYVTHHVKEEQEEMFPEAKASNLDMVALGEKMHARKQALLAEQA
ncbi:hemerythrin domain-containing protein [Methylophilus sp. VKM B-3414]|uniref:hemerythrin domain-containing protein n=1 Tax=Methylophilus sp. VKM B-3414 TaxID=3076121 RepID=UPI0028C7E517|nr:hemerythrin domain-containing protein [Methylophilus sp. VKM B-3414]MDT7849687.1 hemerythrin domain-containing protein [Methylophilus sp. VKM B-3414]